MMRGNGIRTRKRRKCQSPFPNIANGWQAAMTHLHKQLAYAALDAYEKLTKRKRIRPHELERLVVAAKSRYLVAWDIGTVFLARLAESHVVAREAMLGIMESTKAEERSKIIGALNGKLPKEFLLKMIRKAIDDRAKSVRMTAGTTADVLHLKELIPDLQARLETEGDSDVQRALRFHIAMLDVGYEIEDWGDGLCRLTVSTDRGWRSQLISKEQATGEPLRAVLAEVFPTDV